MGGDLRSLVSRHWAPIGIGVLVGIGSAWGATDLLALALVDRFRPELEKQISKPLGHPVRIGAFRGLRPWGIAIGASQILPGPKDDSSVSIQGATIKFAPIASLRRWKPVLNLDLYGSKVTLRRNQQGSYWVLGAPSSAPPPDMDIELGQSQPVKIDFDPSDLSIKATARLKIQLAKKVVGGSAKLFLPEGGRLTLNGLSSWDKPNFRLNTRLEQIRLRPLGPLFPGEKPIELKGQLGGNMQLTLKKGRMTCRGGIGGVSLGIKGGPLSQVLSSPEAKVSCSGGRLRFPGMQWSYGNWKVSLGGAIQLNKAYELDALVRQSDQGIQVLGKVRGNWYRPTFKFSGQWRPKEPFEASKPWMFSSKLAIDWRKRNSVKAFLEHLKINGGGLNVLAAGALYPDLNVSSSQLQVDGKAFSSIPLLEEILGTSVPVNGRFSFTGASSSPRFQLGLNQRLNPLLNRWSLQAKWQQVDSLLRLNSFESEQLKGFAQLPLAISNSGIRIGDLKADINLESFPLDRLGPLLGTPMGGTLSASGKINGPLNQLSPDLSLEVINPEAGPLRLLEDWKGTFVGTDGSGGLLRMASYGAVIPGQLSATLGANWLPTDVQIKRLNGMLSLNGTPALYRWKVRDFKLNGLELAVPPSGSFEGLFGQINGEGRLGLQPFSTDGELVVNNPGLSRLRLKQATLAGQFLNGGYSLKGEMLPPDTGQVTFNTDGNISGPINVNAEVRGLSAKWLTTTGLNIPELLRGSPPAYGRAEDLGELMINTFGGVVDGQLKALAQAHAAIGAFEKQNRKSRPIHLEDLRGQVDAVVDLQGPSFNRMEIDLKARGHLWTEGQDEDLALMVKPFVATMRGPLQGGEGEFSLLHLPFSLLALVAPLPPALRGSIGMQGTYSLVQDRKDLSAELLLEDASLGNESLVFDRGRVALIDNRLNLDLALRSSSTKEPVTLTGQVPLDPSLPLDVRVESHGDGLSFLTAFAGDQVEWRGGETDLKLLFSGSLEALQANGFLVMKDVALIVSDQKIKDLEASMVFDFSRLEVQNLQAKIGANGNLRGQGAIGLLQPTQEKDPFAIEISDARIRLPNANVLVAGNIDVGGALVKPRLGGEILINEGSISPKGSRFIKPKKNQDTAFDSFQPGVRKASAQQAKAPVVSANTLLEEKWDFTKPLALLSPNLESASSQSIRDSIPNLPAIRFENLRLRFGPNLRIAVQPVANFRTKGLLTLNGALDPSLKVQGVVQLLNGRISLLTSTFNLDRRAPNVAVFTPSMGLIPYVDIAMSTKVSDTISFGSGNNAASSNLFESNGEGTLGAGGQLRLVKVLAKVVGPADRIKQNLQLTSSPSMSPKQLAALIGGNSLAGLSGANAGAAIATVFGQALLSPVLGTFSEAFSSRMQVALYPTYVSPQVDNERERVSGRVPPELALVTDIGVDITDQFDFSVLAAPSRSDIPPQGKLTYLIKPNLSISGSVDTQGTWQSELQVFFRF